MYSVREEGKTSESGTSSYFYYPEILFSGTVCVWLYVIRTHLKLCVEPISSFSLSERLASFFHCLSWLRHWIHTCVVNFFNKFLKKLPALINMTDVRPNVKMLKPLSWDIDHSELFPRIFRNTWFNKQRVAEKHNTSGE